MCSLGDSNSMRRAFRERRGEEATSARYRTNFAGDLPSLRLACPATRVVPQMSRAPSAVPAASDRARMDLRTVKSRIVGILRAVAPWCVYVAVAYACTKYLNRRADLVPKRGEWYAADGHPYVLMQVRAFLSGRLALLPHPWSAGHDYDWGRG